MDLEEAKKLYQKTKSNDPFAWIPPALLNKQNIIHYIKSTGMIFPFIEEDLKGITYDARLMGECIYWEYDKKGKGRQKKRVDLQKEGDKIILEPNSIFFLSLQPYFQIPEYIALRYNFKIHHIYKGLLLGTGPIVDPGFTGYLSIPVHNLTDNTYELSYNETMISIEFTKINPYSSIENYSLSTKFQKMKIFSEKPAERKVEYYVNDAITYSKESTSKNFGVINSIPAIEEAIHDIEKFQKRTTKKFKLSVIIGAIIGIITIMSQIFFMILPILSAFHSIEKERVEYRDILNGYAKKIQDLESCLIQDPIDNTKQLQLQLYIMTEIYVSLEDKTSNEAINLNSKIEELEEELQNIKRRQP
jgi:deoxycytidine triphosphate deaminase